MDELKLGIIHRLNNTYGDDTKFTAAFQIHLTRFEEDPDQSGNVRMDFAFRTPDESIDLKDVTWNQRDFKTLARGSNWSISLTSQREETAK